jgi:hypothetical protein
MHETLFFYSVIVCTITTVFIAGDDAKIPIDANPIVGTVAVNVVYFTPFRDGTYEGLDRKSMNKVALTGYLDL